MFATRHTHHAVTMSGKVCRRKLATQLGLDSGTHDDSRCGEMERLSETATACGRDATKPKVMRRGFSPTPDCWSRCGTSRTSKTAPTYQCGMRLALHATKCKLGSFERSLQGNRRQVTRTRNTAKILTAASSYHTALRLDRLCCPHYPHCPRRTSLVHLGHICRRLAQARRDSGYWHVALALTPYPMSSNRHGRARGICRTTLLTASMRAICGLA
jgi:hypothetical protein